jgi:hypothetical protein
MNLQIVNVVRSIRATRQRMDSQHREFGQKLDSLLEGQIVTAEAQIETAKSVNLQLGLMAPSLWGFAIPFIVFILSLGMVIGTSVWLADLSSFNNEAIALEQHAQSLRIAAVEQTVSGIEPLESVIALRESAYRNIPVKTYQSDLTKANSNMESSDRAATKLLSDANVADSAADKILTSPPIIQYTPEIALGVASAFLGATLAWFLTQIQVMLNWRNALRKEDQSKA